MIRDDNTTTDAPGIEIGGGVDDGEGIPPEFRLSSYSYYLPPQLIADEPARSRDESRLLIIDRGSGKLSHHKFFELNCYLRSSDVLVINETRVIPAALTGKKPTGGKVQLLVLEPATKNPEDIESNHTEKTCIFKTSGRLKKGTVIVLNQGLELIVTHLIAPGRATIRFPVRNSEFLDFLSKFGSTPLPPYIRQTGSKELQHNQRYQTIYSKIPGSIAAPTAGLHFSPEMFEAFASEGIETVKITLHIGPGTFMPIRSNDIRLHRMEPEYYSIPERAAEFLLEAKRSRRRIIAVGSTSVRTLEASYSEGEFKQLSGYTDLFIVPGYRFNVVEGMITNFHLPESTLLALVCAFAGSNRIIRAYEEAVRENYRFYSYGDACLII